MRSRRCSGCGWPSGDSRVCGRGVTSKTPSAHVEEGQAAPRRRPQPSSRILTAWNRFSANFAFKKGHSAKFGCRILHRSRSERREDGFLGPPRRVSEIYMLWWCIKIPARE
jgi:hypothetical protein